MVKLKLIINKGNHYSKSRRYRYCTDWFTGGNWYKWFMKVRHYLIKWPS